MSQIQRLDPSDILKAERALCFVRLGSLRYDHQIDQINLLHFRKAITSLIIPGDSRSLSILEALCHAINFGGLKVGSIEIDRIFNADSFSSVFDPSPVEKPIWIALAEDWTDRELQSKACNSGGQNLSRNLSEGYDLISHAVDQQCGYSINGGYYASEYRMLFLLIEVIDDTKY